MATTPFELARICAMAADEKKASDLTLLDLSGLSDVCDYFLICTADNARMLSSIVDEIEEKVTDTAEKVGDGVYNAFEKIKNKFEN